MASDIKRKLVAIGGGDFGRLRQDGTRVPYEVKPMFEEIIRISGKENPNILIVTHARPNKGQERKSFRAHRSVFDLLYGCECRALMIADLERPEEAEELLSWADVIYVCGGDTLSMLNLWQETGFDVLLRREWESGKVMAGTSAGANCWFKGANSDSLRLQQGPDAPLVPIDCLGFCEGFFIPHCDEEGREESTKEQLLENGMIGLMVSNCAAIEIIGDEYRVLLGEERSGKEPYVLKCCWRENEYITERLEAEDGFKSFSSLMYDR